MAVSHGTLYKRMQTNLARCIYCENPKNQFYCIVTQKIQTNITTIYKLQLSILYILLVWLKVYKFSVAKKTSEFKCISIRNHGIQSLNLSTITFSYLFRSVIHVFFAIELSSKSWMVSFIQIPIKISTYGVPELDLYLDSVSPSSFNKYHKLI